MSPAPTPPNPVSNGDSKVTNEELDTQETPTTDTVNADYQILTQQNENNPNNDEDSEESDDDDDDDDDEDEIDPDLDFEQLATTRAYIHEQQQQEKGSHKPRNQIEPNHNLFEVDFFERKVKLECEDIVLDENKTKKITEIMSNFKLDDKFVPNWAKLVPENVWKQNLIDSLNAKKTDLFENSNQ